MLWEGRGRSRVKASNGVGSPTGSLSQPYREFSKWSDPSELSRLRPGRQASMPHTDPSLDEVSVFGKYVTMSSEAIPEALLARGCLLPALRPAGQLNIYHQRESLFALMGFTFEWRKQMPNEYTSKKTRSLHFPL